MLSIVIPVFNEVESLEALHQELGEVAVAEGYKLDIIFVDDGSTDGSTELLRQLAEGDPKVKAVIFRGNFGKAAALSAGLGHCTGKYVVTIDADLQESPGQIPEMLAKIADGADVVSGWRATRNDPWHKRWPSKIYNRVTSAVTRVPLHDHNCGFKAYRREVWEEISIHGELHRYIPALAAWRGFKVVEIEVAHRPRGYGRSKYGVTRLFKGFLDLLTVMLLTRYLARPLHLFGVAGIFISGAGFAACGYLTLLKLFTGESIGGRPLLLLGVLLIVVGMQLVVMGLLGEMVAHLNRGQTEYSVREVVSKSK